jgi:hypothetical protein
VHHRDAVGQDHEFVEVFRYQQDAGAAFAGFEQAALDFGLGADVEAAGRLVGEHDAGVAVEHARQDQLLDIAARQQPRGRVGAGAAHVVVADGGLGAGADGGTFQEAAALEIGPAHLLDDDVLGHRHGADDAVMVAVFGDPGDAGAGEGARGLAPDRGTIEPHVARGLFCEPGDEVGQRRLAVARHPGDADDLAFAKGERGVMQRGSGWL